MTDYNKHTVKLSKRDFIVEVSWEDRPNWELGDQISDALMCVSNLDGPTVHDIISIETKYK